MNKTLTVFTPTYNRKHTIVRTFESLRRQTCRDFEWLIIDDGSTDGTREWVMSLGDPLQLPQEDPLQLPQGGGFDWMGRLCDATGSDLLGNVGKVGNYSIDHFAVVVDGWLRIEYVYKPNGGLYTGYNVAYQVIRTELCVCVDSDDFMPEDAVERIVGLWSKHYPHGSLSSQLSALNSQEYCGITGLDFDVRTGEPIGGRFPEGMDSIFFNELRLKGLHVGDTKQVMRTELMRKVAPMIGFEGEKNFNPIYMLIQVMDKYPVLLTNDNLCWVEYQVGADSMSQGIWRQYRNSPRSFAKMRRLEMALEHNTQKDRFRSAVHYVSSCLLAKDGNWLRNSPRKLLTLLAVPMGLVLYCIIKRK